ncbi:DUF5667 domain-containing protein [Amycolatopsis acidiphila]|uniref:DUF5667 domain-containing protein n=1 Tax=Amycolatopsis acidiphila TaxID=715473 RepID=A0A557ZZZ3_9PSEU|nr:DUF5667 domain-containing protein [Amycolatopsis acidiphila]TVT17588.1 hypothetical protein FNH06_30935 [Amycolatopsis acidiphila]UIJ60505.1 DUF5667 domain-containing protein [Amycolatopsis acidiphila]GHG82485.1 hypothetical protein GCM10017788_53070 [Amycolatopsis acidiphila]
MDVPGWTGRDLEVISGLRQLGDAAKPDAATRERIHTGILERLTEQERRRPGRRRRIVAEVLAAAVALAIALGGVGMLLSKDALPGDALYGIKRAGESAELGLAFGDSAKAQKHLEFAANRLDELKELGTANPRAYESTLADFQREARAGTAELTGAATQGSGQPLDQLRSWSLDQRAKLLATRSAIPQAALTQFTSSAELLSRIEARAQTLLARLNCQQITTGETDDLGAVPQSGSCEPPTDAVRGQQPLLPLPAPPRSEPAPAQQMTSSVTPIAPSTPSPTSPLPPSTGGQAPPVFSPPVLAPTSPRLPTPTVPQPPLISIPPLLPGLPGVGIG